MPSESNSGEHRGLANNMNLWEWNSDDVFCTTTRSITAGKQHDTSAVLGFGPRRDPWPNLCSFQQRLCVWNWGSHHRREEGVCLSLWVGAENTLRLHYTGQTHTHTHTQINYSKPSPIRLQSIHIEILKMKNAVHNSLHTSKDAWNLGRQMSHLSVQTILDSFFKPLCSKTCTTSESYKSKGKVLPVHGLWGSGRIDPHFLDLELRPLSRPACSEWR
jgi:hypothetical protein